MLTTRENFQKSGRESQNSTREKKISSREKIQKVCPWNSKSARENPDQKFAKRILDLILWWAC